MVAVIIVAKEAPAHVGVLHQRAFLIYNYR
jgi:hypothetical protein